MLKKQYYEKQRNCNAALRQTSVLFSNSFHCHRVHMYLVGWEKNLATEPGSNDPPREAFHLVTHLNKDGGNDTAGVWQWRQILLDCWIRTNLVPVLELVLPYKSVFEMDPSRYAHTSTGTRYRWRPTVTSTEYCTSSRGNEATGCVLALSFNPSRHLSTDRECIHQEGK